MDFLNMHLNSNFFLHLCILTVYVSTANIVTKCGIPECISAKVSSPSYNVMKMNNKPLKTNVTGFYLVPPVSNECYLRTSDIMESYHFDGHQMVGVLVLRCSSRAIIHLIPDVRPKYSNVLFQIQIDKCLLTTDSLNAISQRVKINHLSFIDTYPLVSHSYCDGSSVVNADCGFWSSATAIGIILPQNLNSINISRLFWCNRTFPNIKQLLFRRWDLNNQDLLYLKTRFPNLQDLQISDSSLKVPPSFPWNNETFRFNNNMSYSETGFYDSASVFNIEIEPNIWKRVLNLNSNNIQVLTNFMFDGHLDMLKLSRNGLMSVGPFTFSRIKGLQHLDLSENLLSDIPANIFRGLTRLRHINLHANLLSIIPDEMFYDNTELVYLDLSNNSITIIGSNAFSRLHHLEDLRLEYNRIVTISYSMFPAYSVSFQSLTLDGNPMKELPEAIFYFKTLYDVSLRYTNIDFKNFTQMLLDLDFSLLAEGNAQGQTTTEDELLTRSPRKLKRIDLTGSKINNLHLKYFGTDISTRNSAILRMKLLMLLKYFHLILTDNPINCDCKINHLTRFIKYALAKGFLRGNEYFFNDWKCSNPKELRYIPVTQVPEAETYCPKDIANCPVECSCYERSISGVTIVDCRNVGLRELPRSLPEGILDLWFQNNNISTLTREEYLPRTRQLLLTGNKNIRINTNLLQNLHILKITT
ncbi:leucine-rich repeats and immunoglobulin-like domains protein sma-10 [Saccostrea echinata]|uniref:leucine-rich repeats and immunoglobulin-like domains protein sma-10 n=1 Tax=Saccostrea echinata TaxID=191078 RepID=UPI002A82E466|nr:leucine-rich repeats and immunoglobulin-like domains protein sma-10 [Saccostrea echinata]